MVQITHVHMNGVGHEHIAEVRWRNPDTNNTGTSTREAVVAWLRESDANKAYVSDGTRRVFVGVVKRQPAVHPHLCRWGLDRQPPGPPALLNASWEFMLHGWPTGAGGSSCGRSHLSAYTWRMVRIER
jgi:hypothetical protein